MKSLRRFSVPAGSTVPTREKTHILPQTAPLTTIGPAQPEPSSAARATSPTVPGDVDKSSTRAGSCVSKKVFHKEGYGALTSNPSAVSSRIGGRGGAVAFRGRRRAVGRAGAACPRAPRAQPLPRPKANPRPAGAQRDPARAAHRDRLGGPAPGLRLRLG